MKDLPRLELTADPNKNNEYIIFRHSINNTKIKVTKKVTKNRRKYSTRKYSTMKYGTRKYSTKKKKSRKSRKAFFNIF